MTVTVAYYVLLRPGSAVEHMIFIKEVYPG